jgi:acetyltransferase EpsM
VEKKTEKGRLAILGAGLFAEEVAEIVSDAGTYEIYGFVEGTDPERCRQHVDGLPVFWIEAVAGFDRDIRAVCAVGSPERKGFIEQAEAQGLQFVSVRHPSAIISRTASLGEGTVAGAGVIVAAKSVIGRHVILNRGSLIGHHTTLGNYVTVSPGANIAGRVHIADGVYIGMGANVLDGVSIGAGSVVGAGAVVVKDVPGKVQVVGIPARIVKQLD